MLYRRFLFFSWAIMSAVTAEVTSQDLLIKEGRKNIQYELNTSEVEVVSSNEGGEKVSRLQRLSAGVSSKKQLVDQVLKSEEEAE